MFTVISLSVLLLLKDLKPFECGSEYKKGTCGSVIPVYARIINMDDAKNGMPSAPVGD